MLGYLRPLASITSTVRNREVEARLDRWRSFKIKSQYVCTSDQPALTGRFSNSKCRKCRPPFHFIINLSALGISSLKPPPITPISSNTGRAHQASSVKTGGKFPVGDGETTSTFSKKSQLKIRSSQNHRNPPATNHNYQFSPGRLSPPHVWGGTTQ